jgi:hypothetical protein
MRRHRLALAALSIAALFVVAISATNLVFKVSDVAHARAQERPSSENSGQASAEAEETPLSPVPAVRAEPEIASKPATEVVESHQVQGILGREVRSATDENMGRVVDILVDQEGNVRAAIIDFGGFLGVGVRKIAVEWKALRFVDEKNDRGALRLELTRDQVKAAPEYQDGKQVVIVGSLEPLHGDPAHSEK